MAKKASTRFNPLEEGTHVDIIQKVREVVDFLAWHQPTGEVTAAMENGRQNLLLVLSNALEVAEERARHG